MPEIIKIVKKVTQEELALGTMMIKEQGGQVSPLPTDPDRAQTSPGSRGWGRSAAGWAGSTEGHSACVGGIMHPRCLKLLQNKARPALTGSSEQFPRLGKHERRKDAVSEWEEGMESPGWHGVGTYLKCCASSEPCQNARGLLLGSTGKSMKTKQDLGSRSSVRTNMLGWFYLSFNWKSFENSTPF